MSGFEMTRTILTSCQTHSVPFQSAVLRSQNVLPLSQRKPDQHRMGQAGFQLRGVSIEPPG